MAVDVAPSDGCARSQEAALGGQRVAFDVGVVGADRRLEVRPGTRLPRRRAVQLRREVARVALGVDDVSDARRRARVRALVQPADVELVVVREIDADRSVGLNPGERTIVGVQASREALDVVGRGVLHDGAGRERVRVVQRETGRIVEQLAVGAGHSASGRLGALGAALPAEAGLLHVEQADDGTVIDFDDVVRLSEARVGGQVQLRTDRRRQIGARVELVLLTRVLHLIRHRHVQRVGVPADVRRRHLNRAELVVEIRAHVEANGVGATAHVRAVQTAATEVNDRLARVGEVVVAREAVLDARRALSRGERGGLHRIQLTANRRRCANLVTEARVLRLVRVPVVDRPRLGA